MPIISAVPPQDSAGLHRYLHRDRPTLPALLQSDYQAAGFEMVQSMVTLYLYILRGYVYTLQNMHTRRYVAANCIQARPGRRTGNERVDRRLLARSKTGVAEFRGDGHGTERRGILCACVCVRVCVPRELIALIN